MVDARRTLSAAKTVKTLATQLGFMPSKPQAAVSLFDSLVTDSSLRQTTATLFSQGHYALAVEEGYKLLNNLVKGRVGIATDGADLMRNTFSLKKPLLRLNRLKTQSQRDQQLGYMDIFAGCMTGIRNPRAHEHRYLDDPLTALELLAMANHLVRMVNSAKRTERIRARP